MSTYEGEARDLHEASPEKLRAMAATLDKWLPRARGHVRERLLRKRAAVAGELADREADNQPIE